MAELQTKSCLRCGELYDNQLPGMSASRFAKRLYCSKACGNKGKRVLSRANENYELQPLGRVTTKIDIDTCLFKFLSGQHTTDSRKES